MPYNPYSIHIGGINILYSYLRLIQLLNEDDEDYDYPSSTQSVSIKRYSYSKRI